MIRYASLGSGSRGNATLVASANNMVLVDCGFTLKETCQRLERLSVSPHDISALIVTHEHGDHIKGVGPFARKYQLPVHITPGTYKARDIGTLPDLQLIHGYQSFSVGEIRVTPVAVPHDAREPAQFLFDVEGCRLGVLTDLGSISSHVEEHFYQCDALVLEANHDPQMLASGPYPFSLKQRVGGFWGHLSNEQAAAFLHRVDQRRLKQLVVAHISQQNNSLEVARAAIANVLTEAVDVIYACQEQGFDWREVRGETSAANFLSASDGL